MQSKLFKHDRIVLVKDEYEDTLIVEDGSKRRNLDLDIVRQRRQALVDEIQAIDELLAKIDAKNYTIEDKRRQS